MKQAPSQIAFRIRAMRKSRHQSQESFASQCRQQGFPISRNQLAKYELGTRAVPARFIPIIAHVLKVEITDLLVPIGGQSQPSYAPTSDQTTNLSGRAIREFRKKRKWSQHKLAEVIQSMGAPMTRQIIANIETQRTGVSDCELVLFAAALQTSLISFFPATQISPQPQMLPGAIRPGKTRSLVSPNKGRSIPRHFARLTRKVRRFANKFIPREWFP